MRFEYADGRVPVAVWVYEPSQTPERYFLVADQVGSIRAVFDENGVIVKTVDYDSFGSVLSDSDPGFWLPLGFAGGFTDPDTGLIRFGARDYDPQFGRWTVREPLGLSAGLDQYSYCLNNPVVFADPLGLHTAQEELHKIRSWYTEGVRSGALGNFPGHPATPIPEDRLSRWLEYHRREAEHAATIDG